VLAKAWNASGALVQDAVQSEPVYHAGSVLFPANVQNRSFEPSMVVDDGVYPRESRHV
jgi:hypothetical protein